MSQWTFVSSGRVCLRGFSDLEMQASARRPGQSMPAALTPRWYKSRTQNIAATTSSYPGNTPIRGFF
jgi:hypothetical protein